MKKKLLFALLTPLWAQGAAAQLSMSAGIDYSEGKYGGNVNTTQWTVPVSAKYESGPWTAKLALPYVWVNNVNPGARGEALPCGAAVNTPKNVNGIGDLVASGSYNVYQGGGYLVDVGGKVKFATGDADKCLSTGENDYSVQADLAKQLGRFTVFGTAGWTRKGDPVLLGVTTDYRNPFYYTLGGSYKLSDAVSAGLTYDYRQKLRPTSDPISELTLFATYKASKSFKLQGYLLTGFSHASPDVGGGLIATYSF